MKFHCLFEQSGTFKNVFKDFGHQSWDYDILNDYGETDIQIDLFKQIEIEYDNIVLGEEKETIFTNMQPDKDFIIAFFPCTYFTNQQALNLRLENYGFRNKKKNGKFTVNMMDYLFNKLKEREYFFQLFIKFCFICEQKGIPTIIENPKGIFLENYSPYRPSYYENDRSNYGDTFKKPTMYFAINFEMKEKIQMFYDKNWNTKTITKTPTKAISTGDRSKITTTYAKNFYKRFIEQYLEKGE